MARASQQNYSEDEKDDADVDESALAGDADSEKGRAQRDERNAAFRHLSRLHSQGSLNLLTHVRSKDTFEPAKFQRLVAGFRPFNEPARDEVRTQFD